MLDIIIALTPEAAYCTVVFSNKSDNKKIYVLGYFYIVGILYTQALN